MNRIVNLLDDPRSNSLKTLTEQGYGIAGRYPDHKMDYNKFRIQTALEPFTGEGTFQVRFSKNGYNNPQPGLKSVPWPAVRYYSSLTLFSYTCL